MLLLLWLGNQVDAHIDIALCIYFNLVLFDAAVSVFFIDADAHGFVIIDLIPFVIVALVIAVDVVETVVGLVSWQTA